ncbi:hypothetical protein IMZ08_02615 [Bacillus luteolus]|uniref:Uncharacterized protein n=1 Tax=Litchfieldia luteola TaxID=682179 RepID=A0ABR9QEM8_9BACI|nr:hypothetical protein [Cytobacillus luteolus]MBE4906949.1 hypothetical protein [Cytobacillus luteolus]MBP1943586.1 hypothetical protein [Cytobacillus luteolus]
MGTSFSNVQIKTKNIEAVKEALIKLHEDKESDNLFVMGKQKYYFAKSDEWITLLNEMYDGFYYDFSILLSKYINVPMFVIECFDECLLEICFIQSGKIVTKHKSDEEEEFGIDEINEEIEKLKELFGQDINEDYLPEASSHQLGDVGAITKLLDLYGNEEKLTEILKVEDIEEKISSLENLFNIDIWVKADWIEGDDDLKLKFQPLSIEM